MCPMVRICAGVAPRTGTMKVCPYQLDSARWKFPPQPHSTRVRSNARGAYVVLSGCHGPYGLNTELEHSGNLLSSGIAAFAVVDAESWAIWLPLPAPITTDAVCPPRHGPFRPAKEGRLRTLRALTPAGVGGRLRTFNSTNSFRMDFCLANPIVFLSNTFASLFW